MTSAHRGGRLDQLISAANILQDRKMGGYTVFTAVVKSCRWGCVLEWRSRAIRCSALDLVSLSLIAFSL
jgi:hypothetical protein